MTGLWVSLAVIGAAAAVVVAVRAALDHRRRQQ